MEFESLHIRDEVVVKDLVSVHYFEFSKYYKFPGESHNFWELVYVDRGSINAYSEDKEFLLKSGDIIFHKPNEWHNLLADGTHVSNVVVVTFISNSRCMKHFNNRIQKAKDSQRELLSKIISESTKLFKTPLDDPFTLKYEKNEKCPFASEQLIRLYLVELLISIIRDDSRNLQTAFMQNTSNRLVNDVTDFLNSHLSEKITVSDVEKFAKVSRTALESAFKATVGMGVIDYYIKMKIECAKKYIREDSYNITQIADILGYESIHYFSRQFKKITKMSPKEYSNSIKAMGIK